MHNAHKQKKTTPSRLPSQAIVKEVCPECGYAAVQVHQGACPMCKPCPRCGRKLMQCACIEGE